MGPDHSFERIHGSSVGLGIHMTPNHSVVALAGHGQADLA